MARKVRSYDKWRQGSSGSMDAGVAEYNSVNAQVYENGTLGPRPGWKTISTSAGTKVWDGVNDTIRGLGWYRGTSNNERLFLAFYDTSGTAHKYDTLTLSSGTWNSGGTITIGAGAVNIHPPEFDDTPRTVVWNDGFDLSALGPMLSYAGVSSIGTPAVPLVADDHVIDVTSTTVFTVSDAAAAGLAVDATGVAPGSKIDIYDSTGASRAADRNISALVGNQVTISSAATGLSAGDLIMLDGSTLNDQGYPRCVTLYRERAYYWGYDNYPGRVYYSDAADFVHVQTLAFFDVNAQVDEAAGSITGMWPVKNALVIARKDNIWLVLTGTSPENGTLRELGKDPTPDHDASAVADNQVYFLNPTGQGIIIGTPSVVDADSLMHLSPLAYPASLERRPENSFLPQTAIGDDVTGQVFLPGRKTSNDANLVAVERVNGVFNLSKWSRTGTTEQIVFTGGRPGEMYCAVDDTSDFAFFSRDFTLNRPGKGDDDLSVALSSEADTTSGTDVVVDLGEVDAGEGKIVRPIKIVLDVDYWKGGQYSAPSLTIDGQVKGTEASTPEDDLVTQAVTTTTWADIPADLPYTRRVAVALPNAQFGTKFYIRLTYNNLAISNVQVYYDEQDDPR